MTHTTESTLATAPHPTVGDAPSPRRSCLAAGVWCGLIFGAFAGGWYGARAARPAADERGSPALTAEQTGVAPQVDGTPPASGLLWSLVSQPVAQDQLDAIGQELDDPKLDRPASGTHIVSPSDEEVPQSQRWQINFASGVTEPEYARQLAALGVELGVVRDDGTIEYLSNPGQVDPQRRVGQRAEEKRLYWTWSRGNLDKADKSLLKNAGIDARRSRAASLAPGHVG